MNEAKPHISVCICTFKRLNYLKKLLEELCRQQTENRFTYSVVVADNDRAESAKPLVTEFAASSPIKIVYCVQPEQNIALTRNKAIENAAGDFIAFIDDDEFPIENWLLILFTNCESRGVDGVLGPVKPHYEVQPPKWVVKGRFYDRTSYPTGFVIDWPKGRTGNLLFRRRILEGMERVFNPDFLTGEDQDFFRRVIEKDRVFIWCDEAVAYEFVPPIRWKLSFMLKRALLRGKVSLLHPTSKTKDLLKSLIAVPLYLLALPFLFILGQHVFMDYLVKTFDHLGRILAFLRLDTAMQKYVTE